jgi:hypothetical protein
VFSTPALQAGSPFKFMMTMKQAEAGDPSSPAGFFD